MPRICAFVLCCWLPLLQVSQVAGWGQATSAAKDNNPLQIRVLGEGAANNVAATYEAGARATRGITVQVLNSADSSPVAGASVTFQLPDNGPGGTFRSGSRTEMLTTDADGKAEAWGMQWNRNPGTVSLRVAATKNADRTSATFNVLLTSASPATLSKDSSGGHSHKKLWIGLALVAGASVAVAGFAGGKSGSTPTVPPANTTITIGTPTITLTKP